MKNLKLIFSISLVILFLIMTIFLNGCGGLVTPDVDEVKIKGVIQNYVSALNNQNWDEAKSYCVYQSWAYYMVYTIEDFANYYGVGVFTYKIDKIKDIKAKDNYGEANIHIISTIGVWWEYLYLQKINGIWKIYTSYCWSVGNL